MNWLAEERKKLIDRSTFSTEVASGLRIGARYIWAYGAVTGNVSRKETIIPCERQNERFVRTREEGSVPIQAIFGLSVLMSFVAFGLVTKLYIWPWLRSLGREEAILALMVPHTFRFIGLSFLVPGVVSSSLPSAFAAPTAYGDLAAALLATAAAIALSRRASWATRLTWVFNVWGTADFLFAFYQGLFGVRIPPGSLGAAFYIPTVAVPPLFITHGLIFLLFVRPHST